MKKIFGVWFLMMFFIFSSLVIALDNNSLDIYFFYGQGCPHCAKADIFLDEMEEKYSSINVNKYETYFDEQGRNLFINMSNQYGKEIQGVPTIFFKDKVFVGFDKGVSKNIENEIKDCLGYCNQSEKNISSSYNNFNQKLSIPAVISAAIVDAINPCAFAVLIILLSTILVSKKKKKALFSGLAFSLSIFISYFLMGIGLYSAIQATKFTHVFYIVVAILAIFIGLFNLKDYFWYGKWFIMEVPMSWRPKLKALIKSVTSVPGAFFTGFLVSLFLLPCTSGPYIVILGLLSKVATRDYAVFLLLLYNLIFILPMILITFAVYFGNISVDKAEKYRQKKLKILHLIAGLIILILGIFMLISIYLGII